MGPFRFIKIQRVEFEQSLLDVNKATVDKYEEAMEKMEFSVVLSTIWQLVSRTNKYIDETQPWQLAKEEADRQKLEDVMTHLAESLRQNSSYASAIFDSST